ncbi:MAG TPA: 2,3,4,5-tetrahydropyridine-2,6-dicarboxylate N-succinyltransferase, partial [Steroidobacteraceae bacterium]
MTDLTALQATIDDAFERRAELTPKNVPHALSVALDETIDLLDRGKARVAEKRDGRWVTHQWLKKAVLLSFRVRENAVLDAGYTRFYDKVPLKYPSADEARFRADGVRIVPHAIVRKGAYIAPN